MNSLNAIFSLPAAAGAPPRKKRVLLVDCSARQRDLRSDVMRKLGMEVDCAADIIEARSWWRPDLYDLVLIHGGADLAIRDKFCADVRSATPPQQLAFLVGKPEYLADAPNGHDLSPANGDFAAPADIRAAISAQVSPSNGQRWGILEACRQISQVRSLADARSRAMRDRPEPRRDMEVRRTAAEAVSLVENQERKFDEESLRW